MKKVLLRFYSANNLGDDLFIKIITDRYKNKFSLILRKNAKIFHTIDNLKVYRNRLLLSLSYRLSKRLQKGDLWLKFLATRNDILVYIGGSIFIEGNELQRWQREQDFYLNSNIPYYILGSNFGPYKSPEFPEYIRSILENAADVCFRDKASYGIFEDLKSTRVATDPAFSLDITPYETKKEKIAIFSIIDGNHRFDTAITAKYEQEIIGMTNRLIDDGYKVVYMSFCKYEGDETAIQCIIGKLNTTTAKAVEVYNYDGDLEEALSLLATSSIIIGGRFHATILGLLFGKKVLPMAYSDKTINILNDLKFEGDVIDIRKINEFDGRAFDFNGLKINSVDAQIKLAEKQFQELDKVLEKRK